MSKKMSPVVHFEMPFEDRQRMADFYTKTFGWNAELMGEDYGNYVVVHTADTDEKTNMLKQPGAINGGFFERTKADQGVSVVINVDDIQQAMKDVKAAGGTVTGGQTPGEPDDIPGIGLYIAFKDTEGNRVGMLQPHSR